LRPSPRGLPAEPAGPRADCGHESRPATLVPRADGGKHGEEARASQDASRIPRVSPLTRRARRLGVHAPRDPARIRRFRRRPGRIIVVASPGEFDQIVMAAEEQARTCAWPNLSRPTSPPHITRRRSRHPDPASARTEATQAKASARLHEADHYVQIIVLCAAMTAKGSAYQPAPNESSLCQGVAAVFLAACEVVFGRCGFTSGVGTGPSPPRKYGRRLGAPPGRSSSLRCGRSTWICGLAGGRVAAAGECLALPWLRAVVVGWWAGPGVACPKSWRSG
jgi:hypothetical protein